ncbi:histidine phosphatase family protein, partial [Nocardioides sp.]|uniref:histidine phosphatase family protein n=1 Tax=Nocardioides sp. TaxID=35761 RepID=UPI002EDACBDF
MSGPRRLVLLRHGRTAWNHVLRVQGHTDVGLDDAGHEQAAGVASEVAAMRPSLLWTSDLARAQQTAAPVAAATGLAAVPDARLREFSLGEREGLTHEEYAAAA